MKVKVDGVVYPSKRRAMDELFEAMQYCDGSERERMTFAYFSVSNGFNEIDTYRCTQKRV